MVMLFGLRIMMRLVRRQLMLMWIYEDTGRYEEAISAQQKACVLFGTKLEICLRLQQAWERGDAEGYWRYIYERNLESRPDEPHPRAAAYLGKREEALASLEKWYDRRVGDLVLGFLGTPAYDSLRDDPRFQDLRRRIGLPSE